VCRTAQLLHATVVILRRGELLEHLELAETDAVLLLERPFECAAHTRVTVAQLLPAAGEIGLCWSHARHYTARRQKFLWQKFHTQ